MKQTNTKQIAYRMEIKAVGDYWAKNILNHLIKEFDPILTKCMSTLTSPNLA